MKMSGDYIHFPRHPVMIAALVKIALWPVRTKGLSHLHSLKRVSYYSDNKSQVISNNIQVVCDAYISACCVLKYNLK